MLRFKAPILLSLTLAALAWTAAPALAQRGGRGGRGGGGGVARGGYGGYGYGRGGYGGGGYGGGGYGRGGYYGWGGYGWGGIYPYSGYGLSSYSYYPSYYGYDYGTPTYTYPNAPVTIDTRASAYYAPPTDNSAMIHLRVPASATVWVDGGRTKLTGSDRNFSTPSLTPGKTFEYQIKARWMEDGKPVEKTRTVDVRANQTSNVDFLSNTSD